MPRITDPLPKAQQVLTDVVMAAYRAGGDEWPVWQYVEHQMALRGLDAEGVLRAMPTWQHHYRPVWISDSGIPTPSTTVALTAVGLLNSRTREGRDLVSVLLAAIAEGITEWSKTEPMPTQAVEVIIPGGVLTQRVVMRSGINIGSSRLFMLLQHEPLTWGGLRATDQGWVWDVTRQRLRRLADLSTIDDVLPTLEEELGIADAHDVTPRSLPADAVPEALDHLDLAWRVTYKEPLVRLSRATTVAVLSTPAISGDDFTQRCTALGDVLSRLHVPRHPRSDEKAGTLAQLRLRLEDLIDEPDHPAMDAVRVLQRIVGVRNAVAHPHQAPHREQDFIALGLHRWRGDWENSWDLVRTHTVTALRTIREALMEQQPSQP